jgi:hypothetical protein
MTTLAQHVGRVARDIETNTNATEFAKLALFVMTFKGSFSKAAFALEVKGSSREILPPRLADIVRSGADSGISLKNFRIKAASSAISLSGSAFEDFAAYSRGFLDSLINSAFDTIRAAAVPLPFRQILVGSPTVAAQVFEVSETTVKSIARISFASQEVSPLKAAGGIVLTQELARFGVSGGAVEYVQRLLQNAVSVLSDKTFFATILSGVSQNTSTGSTAESVRADIAAMLRQISTASASRLFIVTTATVLKNWSMLTDSKGVSAFPNLTPQGGNINGITCLPSDGLTTGQVVLLDASGLGCAQGEVGLIDISESTLNFSDTPDSPPTAATTMVSLFQNNLTGIAVERFFIGAKIRSDSVALCVNSNSYSSGNSPP